MISENQDIENMFNGAFNGAEELPPESVWENIEKQLDEGSVNGLFKKTFEHDSVEPPIGIWSKIQQSLWMRDFMHFTPNRINIYYTSIVAVIAGLGLFLSNEGKGIKQHPTNINVQKNEQVLTESMSKKLVSPNTITNSNTSQLISHKKTIISSEISHQTKVNSSNEFQNTTTIIQSNSNNQEEMPSGQFLFGDSLICEGTERIYNISGNISNCEIKWTVNPKATIEKLAKNKISLTCNKAGLYKIEAELSNSGGKKTIEYQIRAIDLTTPTIVGNSKICEGTQTQFKLGSAHYISKMYAWDVVNNKYTNTTSGVIVVDCKIPGYDTIKVHDINTKTGCNNTATYPIIIFPKPDADFKIVDNGNGIVDLRNTSRCGQKSVNCKQTVRWSVNDQNYSKDNITVEFTENGIYTAILEVQNEFNCKESVKKDITIDIQNLFVPNAFVSGNDNNSFIPKGENLATYSIEIFDASNKKLWESTQLNDGRPSEGWNGEVDGQMMPYGTYYWKIKATFKDGTTWKGVNQKGRYQTFGTFVLLKKQ